MTKEELEKEVTEYLNIQTLPKIDSLVHRVIKNLIFGFAEPREKRIAKLEAQIEQMKCCTNCKHSRTEYEHCRTDKHEKWEMKEK